MIGKRMVALVTPFTDANTIDIIALRHLVERLMMEGADGFVVLGTTAETPTLSIEERQLILDVVVQSAAHEVPVWVGCGSNSTKESLQLMQLAERQDVDGIMLVTPYYNRPSQEGLFQHFSYLAEHTKRDIMLYQVPKRTGVTLQTSTIHRLIEAHPNITAIKQACTDVSLCTDPLLLQHDVKVLCGEDSLLLPFLKAHAYGIVSVAGHVAMRSLARIMEQFEQDVVDEELYAAWQKASSLLFLESSPSDIKYIMHRFGWMNESVRLPLVPLPQQAKQNADKYMTLFRQLHVVETG